MIIVIPTVYLSPFLAPLFSCDWRFYKKICQYLQGVVCYGLLTGMYLIALPIYSFMNIHDVSWGNRETVNRQRSSATKQTFLEYENYRASIFFVWVVLNTIVGWTITWLMRQDQLAYL